MMLLKSPLRYSQSWEDHRVIEKGLGVSNGDTIVSILSSGDNVLNLLRFEPRVIYGFDRNAGQFHEVKLKITAIKYLEHKDFLKLLGYEGDNNERRDLFNYLSDKLDGDTRDFWKKHEVIIEKGISLQGFTEKKISFERRIFKFFLGKEYAIFVDSNNRDERESIYEKKINRETLRFFSRFVKNKPMAHLFYHKDLVKNLPSTFDYYSLFWKKSRHMCVDIGCINNPYLCWYFTGILPENKQYWQPYLQKEHYQTIKKNAHKLLVFNKDICEGLKGIENDSVSTFYISDIFDWMSYEKMEKNLKEMIRVARHNAKIIDFIIMHDKGIPKSVERNLIYDEKTNKALLAYDRVGFYPNIYLFHVIKEREHS